MNDITRKIEFDSGHRIPDHRSKCRNAHGHRYVLEATVRGAVNPVRRETDDGMVVDFGDLKKIMTDLIGEPWDHAFLVYEGDGVMQAALELLGITHKTVVLPCVPTVENLAALAFKELDQALRDRGAPFHLYRVKLYETPNCFAEQYKEENL